MSVCCLPLRPMAGPTLRSFPGLSARFAGCAAVRCVREVYCRTAGETPLRSLRATPDPKSSAGRTGDRNAASGAWGLLVVGTAALAAIAAEDPSVEVGQGAVGLLFDRTTGDATVRVDHLGRDDGSRRTTVQAVPAAAATGSCERGIVLVGRQGKYQLAQQDIGAVLGREQQGLPPDPAQTRFDGQLFSSSGAVSTNVRPVSPGYCRRRASSIVPSILLRTGW